LTERFLSGENGGRTPG